MDLIYGVLAAFTILQVTLTVTGHAELSTSRGMAPKNKYKTTPSTYASELEAEGGNITSTDILDLKRNNSASKLSQNENHNSNDIYDSGEDYATVDDDNISNNGNEFIEEVNNIEDRDAGNSHTTTKSFSSKLPDSKKTLVQKLETEFISRCDSNHTKTPNGSCSRLLSEIEVLNGGVLPKFIKNAVKLYVCGNVLYSANSLCCGGILYNRTSHQEHCCNNTIYSNSSYVCCNDILHRISSDSPMTECCGVSLYDPRQMFCCGDVLYQREQKSMCCDVTVIDIQCHKCVNSTALQISNDSRCTNVDISESGEAEDTMLTPEKEPSPNYLMILAANAAIVVGFASGVVIYRLYKTRCNKDSEKTDRPSSHLFRFNNTTENTYSINPLVLPPTDNNVFRSFERHDVILSIQRELQDETDTGSIDEEEGSIEPLLHPRKRNDYYKNNKIPSINCLDNYYISVQTQTTESKTCNKRTVFGTQFQHSAILTSSQMFKMPGSDVEVVFPSNGLEVHGSSFYSISDICRRFALPDDEEVASPVTEYHVTGHDKFPTHACVKMPFIGKEDVLRVYKFSSDEGITKTTNIFLVPRKTSENKDQDLFYEIEGSTCLIYTRSFSGFICTTNSHHRPLSLLALLYASYKRLPRLPNHGDPQNEVRTRLYIADELLRFKDYKQRLEDNERSSGRTMKEEKYLQLLPNLTEADLLEVSLAPMGASNGQWIHKPSSYNKDEPTFAAQQVITMADLVQPCQECPGGHLKSREMPIFLEWYLINSPDISPQLVFQGEVSITNRRNNSENNDSSRTTLVIDELLLRSEDRLLAEMDFAYQLPSGKEYVQRMGMSSRQQLRFVQDGGRRDDSGEEKPMGSSIFSDLLKDNDSRAKENSGSMTPIQEQASFEETFMKNTHDSI